MRLNEIFDMGDRVVISKELFEILKDIYLADYMGDASVSIIEILKEYNEKNK